MDIERMRVAMSGGLVRDIVKHLSQQGQVWGVDEDLGELMERLEGEVELSGGEAILDAVSDDMEKIRDALPALTIMEAEQAIVTCNIRASKVRGGDFDFGFGAGPVLPDMKVMGPVQKLRGIVRKAKQEGEDSQNDVMTVQFLVDIDHEAYEIMLEERILEDESNPFGIEFLSPEWKSLADVEVAVKLI